MAFAISVLAVMVWAALFLVEWSQVCDLVFRAGMRGLAWLRRRLEQTRERKDVHIPSHKSDRV